MVLFVQVLVLALTALLWWIARRDLTSKAADARAPAAEDWARLRITVEQLMVELERRAVVAEQRIYEAEQRLRIVEQRLQTAFARTENVPGVITPPETPPAEAVSGAALPAPERLPLAERPDTPLAWEASSPASSAVPLTSPLMLPGAVTPPLAVEASPALPDSPPAVSAPSTASEASHQPAPPAASYLAPEEARYLPIYALADSGETDAAEISRQTGLPRGEIELVLSLRARRST